MRAAEQGFLLLTSHLGDPDSKPLTVAQFRKLTALVRGMERPVEQRELGCEDLIGLGYDRERAKHILFLLNRQAQLEYYLGQGKLHGCYPLTRISDDYPVVLRNRLEMDAPGCLWTMGDRNILNRPAIALVGSRDLQPENRKFAEQAGRQAALQGYVLISGNARGADRTAQDSCLEAGGYVISVVADDLTKYKPQPNVLYLSEDGFNLGFSKIRALSRNRLIHCMGLLTLVAQCSHGKGGTWTGSAQNLRQGWSPLFCFMDHSDAVNALRQMGACGVSVKDLTDFTHLSTSQINMFEA